MTKPLIGARATPSAQKAWDFVILSFFLSFFLSFYFPSFLWSFLLFLRQPNYPPLFILWLIPIFFHLVRTHPFLSFSFWKRALPQFSIADGAFMLKRCDGRSSVCREFLSQTALQGCDYRSLPNPRAVVCECVRTYVRRYVTLYVCYGVSLYGPWNLCLLCMFSCTCG